MAMPEIQQLTASSVIDEWQAPITWQEKQVLLYNKSDINDLQIAFGHDTGVVETQWFDLPPLTPITFPMGGGFLFFRAASPTPFQMMQVS